MSKVQVSSRNAQGAESSEGQESDDEDNIELPKPGAGQKYAGLKAHPTRVQRVVKESFKGIQEYAMLTSAFPAADKVDLSIRSVIRNSARFIGDKDIADRVKVDSAYGNALGHLVQVSHFLS